MEQPVYYWDPVILPSGMVVYSGELFPESGVGHFFVGGLSSQALVRLAVEGDRVVGEERLLRDLDARIREVVQGPDGALYLLTDSPNGARREVMPPLSRDGAPSPPVASRASQLHRPEHRARDGAQTSQSPGASGTVRNAAWRNGT